MIEFDQALPTILWIVSIPFGLIIGSFLNVIIYRLNTGMGVGGRSQCFSCGRTLTILDLVPVISFVCLGGKCRSCQSPISWQYPLVELLSGSLFGLLTFFFPPVSLPATATWLMQIIVACLMIVIFVYDIRHKIIPNPCVYTLILVSLVGLFVGGVDALGNFNPLFHAADIDHLAAGPVLFTPFALLWLVSRGRAIGFGDAKLALFMGWSLGLASGISAIIIGVWLGALISLSSMVYVKLYNWLRKDKIGGNLTMTSEVPFAPYLIIGFYIALLTSLDIFHVDILLN